ncbi:MAG: YncE family protein [Deltaproteobacteria bacterium]|nr:YncE family protein [Deltaproteobacteria bacterium]
MKWLQTLMVRTLLGCLVLLWGTPSRAEIVANWETPTNEQHITGISLISGWAYSTTSNTPVTVKILVDGTEAGDIACCGERADVARERGAQALLSGFGRGVNFSNLTNGNHTLRLEIRDNVAAPTIIERKITAIRVGGFSFLNSLNLLAADANIDGQEVVIKKILAQNSGDAPQETKEVTVRLAWQPRTQTLNLIRSENSGTSAQSAAAPQPPVVIERIVRAEEPADTIRATLENPPAFASSTVGGKGLVSGWAFSATAGVTIASVHLRVDGVNVLTIPCCTAREDVAAGNKDFPQALRSGFATVVNFNELPSAKHKIGVEIRDSNGVSKIIENEPTVVRLGEVPFLEEFNLSQAKAEIEGGFSLFLDKIRIRPRGSTEVREIAARFQWQQSCQCFVPESLCGNGGTEPGEECDGATLGGESCTSLGFNSGSLSCATFEEIPICIFDTTKCTGGPTLYVTNVLDDTVSVINTATNIVTDTIKVGHSPRGIAISPDGATAYVTAATDDEVTVVDTTTNAVTTTVPVGQSPQGVAVMPDGTKVYVVNSQDDSVTVLNTATKQVATTIPVGKEPQAVVFAPDGKTAYVTNFSDNTVSVINTATDTVQHAVDLGAKKGPDGIAVTPDGKRALVVNFNGDSFSILDTLANPVAVIGEPVTFGLQPVKVAISADGTRAYISSVLDSIVGVFDLTVNPVVEVASIGSLSEPEGLVVSPKGKRLYVAGFGRSGTRRDLDVISTINGEAVTGIRVGRGPFAVALKPAPAP